MNKILEAESTLTDRYQTTIPESIRRALNLRKKDKIVYSVTGEGDVVLSRANTNEQEDPAIGQFLDFLAHDIATHPERIQAFDATLINRLKDLIVEVEVDLDAPLSGDDE